MISVIIPSYKNTPLLLTNFKKNIPYLKGCEIIIVNDDPEKSIRRDLHEFKSITLLENEKNLGFSGAVNRGVKRARGEYLLLLNTDIVLHDAGFKQALAHFEKDSSLFAVSFAQRGKNQEIVGKNKIYWGRGFFRHSTDKNTNFGKTAWAEGGSAIFDREKFLKLGGFDELYSPFYWEDIDLSYRAWKTGFTILFDPEITVTHHHESTIGKYFTPRRVKIVSYRNQFTFIWKNIQNPPLLASHFFRLPFIIPLFIIKGEVEFARGFFAAVERIGKILQARRNVKKELAKSDEEILNLFKDG